MAKNRRTRTGCLGCRRKKRKCDEVHPRCGTCMRRDEPCHWGLKVTFREENALGLDEMHPSMRKGRLRRARGGYEILDVTGEVIRDHERDVELMREDDLLRDGDDDESPITPQHTDIAVASLIHLSRGGRSEPVPGPLPPLGDDDLLQFPPPYLQVFTPEGSLEDGVFMPGSAYAELHTTLRHHLIQEVRSNVPTRAATPEDQPLPDSSEESARASLAPVDTPLLTSEEEIVLWRNWIDEVAPWLDKFDNLRHFQNIIPCMASSHPHLRYAILALSARQIELKETTRATGQSLSLYQQAIHLLLPELPTRSTAVIASCVILCVLEMGSCSPKAWRRHLDGCASLMLAVGIHGFVGGVEQALFWCFARMDVCGGLISSVKTLIPITHWVLLPGGPDLEATVQLFKAKQEFDEWANYSAFLLGQVLDLVAPTPSAPLDTPSRTDPSFRDRWLQLWSYLIEWHALRPAPLYPILTIPSAHPFPKILYSNGAAISGNQLHHTASILMLQAQPPGLRLAPKPRSILWHARQVCAISMSNDHHGAWTNCVQPLWIAGRCMSSREEHRAIVECLERIERESGWKTQWRVDDLKEFWGDLE
ncbi:C6 zinc finger domain-containing protein [Emericellopsis atlantica]|uniref:C6 zinc finger domain-containing protein n=1 Tax=Emericellopsis atlantica TaxID=2614577 RepID=A0A9P7ZM76_9HYPO|nr:C6 zinc finger domain-containing protein [Emericellopsis atlantica]KAG9254501.1 C6 zinc finger domain-containing protein [Emericellopsis atlantica]